MRTAILIPGSGAAGAITIFWGPVSRTTTVVAAIDETGREKAGTCTAGVKRQYMGCAGRVANGINTVHVALAREKAWHALIGAAVDCPRAG